MKYYADDAESGRRQPLEGVVLAVKRGDVGVQTNHAAGTAVHLRRTQTPSRPGGNRGGPLLVGRGSAWGAADPASDPQQVLGRLLPMGYPADKITLTFAAAAMLVRARRVAAWGEETSGE